MLLPLYRRKLWKVIFENYMRNYLQMVIRTGYEYSSSKLQVFLSKLEQEQEFTKAVFCQSVPEKEVEEGVRTISFLVKALREDADQSPSNLYGLSLFMGKSFDEAKAVISSYLLEQTDGQFQKRLW